MTGSGLRLASEKPDDGAPPAALNTRLPARPSFHFLDDCEVERLPPIEWLVDSVLPTRSIAEIHAPPGDGKTFLAMDIALSVGSGRSVVGRAVRRGPVIYVAAEGSAGLGARVSAWKAAHGAPGRAGVLFVTEPVHLLEHGSVGTFLGAVDTLEHPPVLIVLDTLARCLIGGEENSAKDMGLAVASIDQIRRSTGAAVLVVHHTRKDGETERGSTALRGAADVMMAMKREDTRVTLSCDKMKDAAEFPLITLELVPTGDSCALITANAAMQYPDATVSSKQREALQVLHEAALEDGLSVTAWLKASGMKDRTFYAARKALVAYGYVNCAKNGRSARYTVTPVGRAQLTADCKRTANELQCSRPALLHASPSLLEGMQQCSDGGDEYKLDERAGIQEDR